MLELASLLVVSFVVGMWCYAIYVSLYLAGKRGELTRTWMVLGIVPFIVGYVIDVVLFNWIIASVVLREWPKERTFSARLNRWWRTKFNYPLDYRHRYIFWWARQLNALTPDLLEHIHKHDRPSASK